MSHGIRLTLVVAATSALVAVLAIAGAAAAGAKGGGGKPGGDKPQPGETTEPAPSPDAEQAPAPACDGADARPASISAAAARRSVLCLINDERARRGLPRLHRNRGLGRVASRHARDMDNRNFFRHQSQRTLLRRVRRSGYLRGASFYILAENLGWGSRDEGSPGQIFDAWMESPGHRRNILDRKLEHVGVSVVWGAPKRLVAGPSAIYTTEFGRRR
jgi:uncharacterized protein YkwD